MAENTYEYTASSTIVCSCCKNLGSGDTVDVHLDQVLIPALPFSIRGVVQLVDNLTYTIQYDDADLLGVIPVLADAAVTDVTCVDALTLAQEYSDSRDETQDTAIEEIESALAALGVVPSDGSDQFVVHPDSASGVSVQVFKHVKREIASSGVEVIVIDPEDMATALAIADLTGLSYVIEVDTVVLSDKSANNRDSLAKHIMVGDFDSGATHSTIHLVQNDATSIVGVNSGNNFSVTVANNSSAGSTIYLTAKFRILS